MKAEKNIWNVLADFAEYNLLAETKILVMRSTGITEDEWHDALADFDDNLCAKDTELQDLIDEEGVIAEIFEMTREFLTRKREAIGVAAIFFAALQAKSIFESEDRAEAENWLNGPLPSKNLNINLFIETALAAMRFGQVTMFAQLMEYCRLCEPAEIKELETVIEARTGMAISTDTHLYLVPDVAMLIADNQGGLRRILGMVQRYGVAAPLLSSSLAYFDVFRSRNSAADYLFKQ